MERTLDEKSEYILPIKLDNTEISGIRTTTGYLDLREMTVADIFKALEEKIVKDRELSAQALAKATQFRYSFGRAEGKEPVHPMIVRELLGGDDWIVDSMKIARVNVDRSRGSNRCFHTECVISEHGGRIWVECPDVNGLGQFFRYTHIDTSPSGTVILECYRGFGGPELFGEVGLFQWKTSDRADDEFDLAIVERFSLGDRYEGKVAYEGGVLYIHPDQSPLRDGPASLIERRID